MSTIEDCQGRALGQEREGDGGEGVWGMGGDGDSMG